VSNEKIFPHYRLGTEALDGDAVSFVATRPSVVLLHDGHLEPAFVAKVVEVAPTTPTILDVNHSSAEVLERLSPETGVLYACLQDDLGLPFVDAAYARQMKVRPVWYAQPRDYLSRNMHARRSLTTEFDRQRAGGYFKLDFGYGDFANLIQAFESTRGRPGWIVEVGCFCGSSAGALLSYVASRQAERGNPPLKFHFMDVFEGFDYPEAHASSDMLWAGTHATDGLEAVRARIQAYGNDAAGMRIEVSRNNVITDPVPEEIVRDGVRMANIDVDLYEAVAAGLARYAPLMVPGGIMICEDAGHTPLLIGALKAVEEFMDSEAGRQFCRIDLASGQTLLIKTGA